MTTGAVLLVACVAILAGQRHLPTAFGALPAAVSSTAAPSTSPTVPVMTPKAMSPQAVSPPLTPVAPVEPSPSAPPPVVPARSGPAAPLTVSLPDLGVSAPVIELLTLDGVLHPPADPAVVGWWTASALVGAQAGSTVLAGHVDSAEAGPGALAGLSELTAGSPVEIATESGTTTYTVSALLVLDKGAGLPPELFTRTGPPRLVLVTCGGPFDATTLSYRDNIVVLADPD